MIHLRPAEGAITAATPEMQQMRDLAQKMESQFLAEMLKHAGLGETPDAFGGGHGEAHFASFLREEHAKAMVDAGGIGLSEQIFQAMVERARG